MMYDPNKTIYYETSMSPTIFRSKGPVHEVFTKRGWEDDGGSIIAHMVGEENNLSEITEAQARAIAPAAFN